MAPTPTPLQPLIAVLGCGWLGLPLAQALVEEGYAVAGSTTTPSRLLKMRDAGITPYLLELGPTLTATDQDTLHTMLTGARVLVLNVPPSAAKGHYVELLQPVYQAAIDCGVRHVLFVSSTGVYADEPRTMTEDDALAAPDANSELLRAESLFTAPDAPFATTVVRLAGLIGPRRAPGRFLAGRTGLPKPQAPVNLIHLTDCLGILGRIIRQRAWGRTFNASAAHHPTRQEFYTAAAAHLELAPPTFVEEDTLGKCIDSELLRQETGYMFQFDDLNEAMKYC
ncbi:SDR family oxidoreductase [Hymenobacter profundi]|uniref:SDR family oxidoreductase n=1 Tax=Hymenobacter profundi TaxID=1982110 RepID=A0ABS6WYF2_9BACT|nr:SDR family oxidoreductase [Hymenobacter profundi]MBW3128632.1 SDR family oxidoreductase [Hymenobacter profundi]